MVLPLMVVVAETDEVKESVACASEEERVL